MPARPIDGTILNPGDEFSFNKIVGERTKEKGYLAAIVYTDGGKSESQEGGGICQVASTIYTCTLLADLEVTERAPHMYLVTYVEPGMDATTYWPSLDYKFKNSTDMPLRVDASVSGGYVHIKLVGTKQEHDYDHIKLRGVYASSTAWKTVAEINGKKTEITIAKGAGVDANGKAIDLAVDAAATSIFLVLSQRANIPATRSTPIATLSQPTAARCALSFCTPTSSSTATAATRSRRIPSPSPKCGGADPTDPNDPSYDPDDNSDDNGNGDSNNDGTYTGDPSVMPDFWN